MLLQLSPSEERAAQASKGKLENLTSKPCVPKPQLVNLHWPMTQKGWPAQYLEPKAGIKKSEENYFRQQGWSMYLSILSSAATVVSVPLLKVNACQPWLSRAQLLINLQGAAKFQGRKCWAQSHTGWHWAGQAEPGSLVLSSSAAQRIHSGEDLFIRIFQIRFRNILYNHWRETSSSKG